MAGGRGWKAARLYAVRQEVRRPAGGRRCSDGLTGLPQSCGAAQPLAKGPRTEGTGKRSHGRADGVQANAENALRRFRRHGTYIRATLIRTAFQTSPRRKKVRSKGLFDGAHFTLDCFLLLDGLSRCRLALGAGCGLLLSADLWHDRLFGNLGFTGGGGGLL